MNHEEMTEKNKVYGVIHKTDEEYRNSLENKKHSTVTIDVHSGLFKIIALVSGILGIISGIVGGKMFPMAKVEYEYKYVDYIRERLPVTEEVFNWPLMFGIWIAFAVVAVSFWAIYCHLANQEETIKELKILNTKIK